MGDIRIHNVYKSHNFCKCDPQTNNNKITNKLIPCPSRLMRVIISWLMKLTSIHIYIYMKLQYSDSQQEKNTERTEYITPGSSLPILGRYLRYPKSLNSLQSTIQLSHERNPLTFHCAGCLIGILIMVDYNPHIGG